MGRHIEPQPADVVVERDRVRADIGGGAPAAGGHQRSALMTIFGPRQIDDRHVLV